jgi:hypothetical protein
VPAEGMDAGEWIRARPVFIGSVDLSRELEYELADWRIRYEVSSVSQELSRTLGPIVASNRDRKHFLNEGSRLLGERSCGILVPRLFPRIKRAYPVRPGSRSGDFDAVYTLHEPERLVVIVEAKGGTSRLGYRNVGGTIAQQGTLEYLQSVATTMAASSDRTVSDTGALILEAGPETLLYLKIGVGLRPMPLREWRPIVEASHRSMPGEKIADIDVNKSRQVSVGPVELWCFDLHPDEVHEAADKWRPLMEEAISGDRPDALPS